MFSPASFLLVQSRSRTDGVAFPSDHDTNYETYHHFLYDVQVASLTGRGTGEQHFEGDSNFNTLTLAKMMSTGWDTS